MVNKTLISEKQDTQINKSLVSIIVPIYKAEKYINKCIDSILCQSYKNLEIILIDDGSPDNCGTICGNYAKLDFRIKVIHQENEGVSMARYNGVKASKGEWIFFMDADDIIPKEAIKSLYDKTDGYDIVSGKFTIIDNILKVERCLPKHIQESGNFTRGQFINSLLKGNRLAALWRQLIKRKVIESSYILIPRDIKIGEDFLLNLKLGLGADSVLGINELAYIYYIHPNNTTNTTQLTISQENRHFSYIEKILYGHEEYDEALFRYCMNLIYKYINSSDLQNSLFLLKANNLSHKFNKNSREVVLLFLSRIHNKLIRKILWLLYLFFAHLIYNLFKFLGLKKK